MFRFLYRKKSINHKEVTEFDLLRLYVEEMEHRGVSRQQMWIAIDEEIVARLSAEDFETTLPQVQKLADKCIAKGWLEHNGRVGRHAYDNLELTATGLGVIRSRQLRQRQLEDRGRLKRISDYIEDHKGLFLLLGSVVTISGLIITIIKLFSKGSGP